jgi:HAE1 family hydrophobic/amphiphilic exporter-1
MLDYYNQLRGTGMSVKESLIEACSAKLKAILMSNIAVILGVIPMAMGIGESLAEMRQPMGVVVTGGIVSSTIMTLWLIPCLEYIVRREPAAGSANQSAIESAIIEKEVEGESI